MVPPWRSRVEGLLKDVGESRVGAAVVLYMTGREEAGCGGSEVERLNIQRTIDGVCMLAS